MINVKSIPLPCALVSKDGKVVQANEDAAKWLEETSVENKLWIELMPSEKNLAENWSFGEIKNKKVLLHKIKKREGFTYVLFFCGKEYTALLEEAEQLRQSNRALDAIIESSYDGIYITDNKGNTLKTNSAIERITGIPKEYYIGKNINDLINRGILKESVSDKVIKTKGTVNIVQKNFNKKETMLTGSPIFDTDGEVEKIVTNIRDLSELNELHEELNKAKELNQKYEQEIQKLIQVSNRDPNIILKSNKIMELFEAADRLADVDATIFISGETGVGKEIVAKHLYKKSDRSETGQFIKINCGALPKDLLEAELFGYEQGAFTGASKKGKAGVFEQADQGVLFLDEVGEMPENLQVKMLRVLQEKEVQRIGGTQTLQVDTRIITATNKDLKQMVEKGEFREDLYYRLHVIPLNVPPLRERKDDILPLVHHFLHEYNEKYHMSKVISKDLKDYFYYYHWPGNVRELSNMIERLVLTVPLKELSMNDLPEEYRKEMSPAQTSEGMSLKEAVEQAEYRVLKEALDTCKTTYDAAIYLRTSQATIVRKLQKYNLST